MDAEKRRRRSKKFLREQVYQNLKNSIITGEHEPDGRLIEEDLAAKTGTSRTPVREALQKLEKEGLIYRRSRGGFAVKGVAEEEVDEVFGLRSVLEGYAAYLATGRVKEDEVKALEGIVARQETCLKDMDTEEFIRLDREFHDVIYGAAKNVRLAALLNDLRDYMYRYRFIILRFYTTHSRAVDDHKKMLTWMKAGNAKQVEKVIRKHIVRGKNLIKKKIRISREAPKI